MKPGTSDQIVYLTLAGMPAKTISSVTGVSQSVISQVLKRKGLSPRPRTRPPLPPETQERIREMAQQGHCWPIICRELGCARADVEKIVRDVRRKMPKKKKIIEQRFIRFQSRTRQEFGVSPEWLKKVLRDALGGK
jgi:transposase